MVDCLLEGPRSTYVEEVPLTELRGETNEYLAMKLDFTPKKEK